jgi:tetratricopeptide (TPR) repeat protein
MHSMTERYKYPRAVLIGTALALLLAIAPDRGTFPATSDIIVLQRARDSGADLVEWRWLARFVSDHPHNARIWERMAILDYRNGLCQQADLEFHLASEYGGLSPDNLAAFGECLLELGKSQEAIDLLSPHLGDKNPPAGLELLLARAYLRQGKYDKSLLILNGWALRDQQNPRAAYTLALYQALTEPAESLINFQNAVKQNPEYEKNYREMQTAINTSQLNDNRAYLSTLIGRAYGNLNEWELAEYAFLTAVQYDPGYAESHAWLGEARQHLGADGSSELQAALELNPDSILAQALNALYLQREGKPEQALLYLLQISEAEPSNPEWKMALGQTNAQLGRLEEAREYFQQAVLLAPGNVATWQALAEFCFTYQYEVQATGIPAANKTVLLSPDNPRSLDLAGQAALSSSNLGSAEDYLRRAIELDPRFADAHLHLALVLLQHDNIVEAQQELEKAATLGSLEAENLLAQISRF